MQNDKMEEPQRRVTFLLKLSNSGSSHTVSLVKKIRLIQLSRRLAQLVRLVKPGSFFTTDMAWIINRPFMSGRFDL